MAKKIYLWVLFILLISSPAFAATFNSGSTGALGNVTVATNTTIPLPANGMLNYSSLTVNSGATLTFSKNANNTPVYILATGNVTINGSINVSASSGSGTNGGAGGPGGYSGGNGGLPYKAGEPGRGPGGGGAGNPNYGGGSGGFGTAGGNNTAIGGSTYGSANLLPLIGGSGGGGAGGAGALTQGGAGGGGGGAILIAASGTLTVNGSIFANGGDGSCYVWLSADGNAGAGGSGGAIRLLATTISGNGSINAVGGGTPWGPSGGNGRIDIEALYINRTSNSSPGANFSNTPYWVFPANNINTVPTLKIVSVGGLTPASHPYGDPDILLSAGASPTVDIVVQAANIPVGTNITVTATPNAGGSPYISATASLTGTDASLTTATVQLTLNTGSKSTIGVYTDAYTIVASKDSPLYVNGEKVEKMIVSANADGSSTVTYITESGKKIIAKS